MVSLGWIGTEERILGPGVTPQSLPSGQKGIPQHSGCGHPAGYIVMEPKDWSVPAGQQSSLQAVGVQLSARL